MSNNSIIVETILSRFTPDAKVRYGLDNVKTRWDLTVGLCTYLRACAHNPFGADDQYNRKLRDRELARYGDIFKSSLAGNEEAKKHFFSFGNEECPKNLIKLRDSVTFLNKIGIGEKLNSQLLAILAEACIDEKQEAAIKHILELYSSLNDTAYFSTIPKDLGRKAFLMRVVCDTVVDCKKQEIGVFSNDFRSKLFEKLELRRNELASPLPSLASRTQALLSVMKSEFVFLEGLGALETIFSTVSTALSFSLTNWLGFMTFGASLFVVIATLPYAVALMEASWQQLASYGDKGGPKNLENMAENILTHMCESWNKAVYSDKSFHPLVSAFLDICFVMTSWSSLAFVGIDCYAFRYVLLDAYLNIKASLIAGKDYDTSVRDAFAAVVSGFSRGLIKSYEVASAFDLFNGTSIAAKIHYDVVVTYIGSVLGHVMRLAITQFLSPKVFKDCIQSIKQKLLEFQQVRDMSESMNSRLEGFNTWLHYNPEKKLV